MGKTVFGGDHFLAERIGQRASWVVGAVSLVSLMAAWAPGLSANDGIHQGVGGGDLVQMLPATADPSGVAVSGTWDNVSALTVRGRDLDVALLRDIYEANGNQPLWSGRPREAELVLGRLRAAYQHGLVPRAYYVEELTASITGSAGAAQSSSPQSSSPLPSDEYRGLPEPLRSSPSLDLELLMTAGVAKYARDIHVGRVAPRSINREFDYDQRSIDQTAAVLQVSRSEVPDSVMQSFAPPHDDYGSLVGILEAFRSLARDGGWPTVADGPVIRPGQRDSRLPVLRERLAITGDYRPRQSTSDSLESDPSGALSFDARHQTAPNTVVDIAEGASGAGSRLRQEVRAVEAAGSSVGARNASGGLSAEVAAMLNRSEAASAISAVYSETERLNADDPEYYDDRLAIAVERFQARHGLTVDGIIGPQTFEALNVPVEARIEQVIAGMERWRWLPRDLSQGYGRHIMVNIAGFTMDVVEDGDLVMRMPTVVGRPSRQTPLFSSRMTWLEFNPTWTIPTSIAVNDMLPSIRNDPDYFYRSGITVYDGWGEGAPVIDDRFIDWDLIGTGIRGFRLVQSPGPQNSLGKVKFMMANNFSVYLHDTPARYLFSRDQRAYSSGCIRVEDPMWLADYAMAGQAGWQSLRQRVNADWQTRRVNLERHIPVHLAYHTAWRDEDGVIQIRGDIYGIDRAIGESLIGQGGESDRYALIMP